jgi:hypothetical protein
MQKRYRVTLTLSKEEYERLEKLHKETNLPFATMINHILLEKKITVFHRNRSMDEAMEELIILRKQLLEVGPKEGLDLIGQINDRIFKLSDIWLQ